MLSSMGREMLCSILVWAGLFPVFESTAQLPYLPITIQERRARCSPFLHTYAVNNATRELYGIIQTGSKMISPLCCIHTRL
jgi:hypothetical protein